MMKIKNNTLFIILFILMFLLHFGIWEYFEIGYEMIFIKYYLFLTLLFVMVLTIISIIKKIYPTYIGFAFLGLIMFKLILMFLIIKKLNLTEVPNYRVHFIIPYLISLALETLYAVNLVQSVDYENKQKDE